MQSLSGLPEVPCVRCQRRVRGLGWGELCPDCRAERHRRASQLASRISLAATVVLAAYVALRLPAAPLARLYRAIAVLATYIIVRRIVTLVAMEYMK